MLHKLAFRSAIALLVLATCAVAGQASAGDFAEQKLLADAADGRLDHFSLLDAATIAGGVSDKADVTAARGRLESLWLEVGQPLIVGLPQRDRARAIFSATHRLVLTGKYHAECTEVNRTLATGDFNCVTATVLYLDRCRRHGLEGFAVAIPGHVYCRLSSSSREPSGTKNRDVQTTCVDWFDVQEGRAASAAAAALTRQIAAEKVAPRELTDVQLIGKVYYNRGVSYLEAHDYAKAIELLEISIALDAEDQPAANNLLAAHNNWALALCDAGDFTQAAEKLAAARTIDPHYAPLQTNDLYVHQKWVLRLCDLGRYSAAVDLLDQGFQRRPEAPLFDGGRFAVYGMWSKSLLEAGRLNEALTVLQSARKRFGENEELLRQEMQAFESAIDTLTRNGDEVAAARLAELARSRNPQADFATK